MGTKRGWALCFGAAIACGGCAAPGTVPAEGQAHAGWYLEHAGQGRFQPCGQSRYWRLSGSTELRARARRFGLERDTPIYVRLIGASSPEGDELKVTRVLQFGSNVPVRDCGMSGVAIPDDAPRDD